MGWAINTLQWRIQDFPQGGAPTPKVGVLAYFFGQKLHENERIWTPGGGARVPGAPLDPPLHWLSTVSCGSSNGIVGWEGVSLTDQNFSNSWAVSENCQIMGSMITAHM